MLEELESEESDKNILTRDSMRQSDEKLAVMREMRAHAKDA